MLRFAHMLLLAAISKATRAQLLLRWPRNVDQVKFSLSSGVGLPAFNALILEYCHKSHIADLIPKAGFYFFILHLCRGLVSTTLT